ncbi:glycosyltransferase [Vibrio fluvialis]|nr:glycosyltransferase [Vibrio fluvialis]
MSNNEIKIAIVYRVVQSWRAPVFERLSNLFKLKVFYGCDFPGTKVVSLPKPHPFPSQEVPSFPLRISRNSGNMLLPISYRLYYELREFNPDVVVCEGASNFINNLVVFLYCKVHQKSMIQWGLGKIKGRKDSTIRRLLNPFIQPIERRADAVICYSLSGTHYYLDLGIDPAKIFVATNVVDTDSRIAEIDLFRKDVSYITDQRANFNILFVGALENNKNVDLLIKAFALLKESYLNITLTIIGDGAARRELEDLVTQLSLNETVKFLGRISGPLIQYIHQMDVNIMPGLGGLVVSDMLCHGIPTICSVGDGCEADLIDGTNGIILDEMTEKTIFNAVSMLIDNPSYLSEMKRNARLSVDKYNINSYVKSISDAIYFANKSNK